MHFNKQSANTAACYIHSSNDLVSLLAMYVYIIYILIGKLLTGRGLILKGVINMLIISYIKNVEQINSVALDLNQSSR